MLEKIVAEFHPRKDLDYSYYLRFEQFPQTTGVVEYFSFLGKELAGVAYTFARPLVRGSTLGATAGAGRYCGDRGHFFDAPWCSCRVLSGFPAIRRAYRL